MNIEPGVIALISGGRVENLGKSVFVVGNPEDPRLPDLGGTDRQWDVQMLASPLIGDDGEGYLRSKIGENCLTLLHVAMDQAREMRERALTKIVEIAVSEILREEWWGESPND